MKILFYAACLTLALTLNAFTTSAQSRADLEKEKHAAAQNAAPSAELMNARARDLTTGAYTLTEADAKEYFLWLDATIKETPAFLETLNEEQRELYRAQEILDLYKTVLLRAAEKLDPSEAPAAPDERQRLEKEQAEHNEKDHN